MKRVTKKSSNSTMAAQLSPLPFSMTPPEDPPQVLLNARKNLVLDLDVPFTANSSTFFVGTTDLEAALCAQLGVDPANSSFKMLVRWISVWGPQNPLTTTQISLQDTRSGISVQDDSALSRARVGLSYPKTIQHPLSSSEQVVTVWRKGGSSAPADVYPARVGVTYWGSPDFA